MPSVSVPRIVKVVAGGLAGAAYTAVFASPLTGWNSQYLLMATPAILIGATISEKLTSKEIENNQQSVAKNPLSFYQRSSSRVGSELEIKENEEVDAAPFRP